MAAEAAARSLGSVSDAGTAILWDIDGTLVRAAGAGVRSFVEALRTVTGLEFPGGDLDMGGRTDPDIAERILRAAGIDDGLDDLVVRLLDEVAAVYAAREAEFQARTSALAGARAALDAFAARGTVQTVVTGNIRPVARMKLTAAGLADRLDLDCGAYGSDHRVRAELVRVANRRIAATVAEIDPARTWVIGDTPRDLECARAAGVRCVLVATGTNGVDKLAPLGADAVLADLTDLDPLLDLLLDR